MASEVDRVARLMVRAMGPGKSVGSGLCGVSATGVGGLLPAMLVLGYNRVVFGRCCRAEHCNRLRRI